MTLPIATPRTARPQSVAPSRACSGLDRLPAAGLLAAVLYSFTACADSEPQGMASAPAMTTAGRGASSTVEAPPKPTDDAPDASTPEPSPAMPGPAPAPQPAPEPDPAGDPEAQCETCLETRCSARFDACVANTACGALVACLMGCAQGDAMCVQACEQENAAGRALLDAFVECGSTMCAVCTGAAEPPAASDPNGCIPTDPSGWTEGTVWTQAEVQACLDVCDDDQCVAQMCEGGERFLECVGVAGTRCAGAPSGPCRSEYEAFWCCIDGCESEAQDMAGFEACLDRDCSMQREQWFQCRADDMECIAPVRTACISGGP